MSHRHSITFLDLGPSTAGRDDRRGEQGAVLVLVALAAVVLLGAVALGLDGSRLLEERRAAQAAVDHAAAAAAFSSCTGSSLVDAIAAGEAAAARNGYDDDGTTNVVTIGATGSANEFRASITSTIGGTFSRILGFTTFDVTVEGIAGGVDCDLGIGDPGAIYAGGTCPIAGKFAIDVPGSTNQVIGGVHANDDVSVGGSSNLFTDGAPPADPFTHVASIFPGAGNTFEAGYPLLVSAPLPPWPGGWDPSLVTGTGSPPTAGSLLRAYYDLADANGTTDTNDTLFSAMITSITKDGVYYTTSSDGMDISSITGSVRNVALIAPNGPIKISASSKTLNAITDEQLDAIATIPTTMDLPRPGILMLSNAPKDLEKRCEEYTISLSGSDVDWNGFMWAPTGQIEMNGSTNVAVNGGLVGWSVKLNGSNLRIAYDASLLSTDPSVLIVR